MKEKQFIQTKHYSGIYNNIIEFFRDEKRNNEEPVSIATFIDSIYILAYNDYKRKATYIIYASRNRNKLEYKMRTYGEKFGHHFCIKELPIEATRSFHLNLKEDEQ